MNLHTQYLQFCREHANDEQEAFFDALAVKFGVNYSTALNIWYAEQRSWFKPEMIAELIRLDKAGPEEFRPILASGEFEWDEVNCKFVPEKVA
jgi:hypothetical protein